MASVARSAPCRAHQRPRPGAARGPAAAAVPPPSSSPRSSPATTSRGDVSASAATFAPAPSCPWPRSEVMSVPVQRKAGGAWKSRVVAVVAKLMNGETGALPPAVAPLAGAFTDGAAATGRCEVSAGPSSDPPPTTLGGKLAALWRYRGLS